MNKPINICNIYILLWIFGYIQSMFITSSFVSLLFSIPSLFITLFCFVKLIEQYRLKGAILVLSIFFMVLVFYGFGLVVLGNAVRGSEMVKRNSFLLMAINSLGPIFSFYYFTKREMMNTKQLIVWFYVLLVVNIIHYYDVERHALERILEAGSKFEDVTNNAAYSILGLFPFLFLLNKKPVIQYIALGIILFFVISGLKRGAILVAAFLLVWFVYISTKFSNNTKRFFIIVLTIIVIIVGWEFITRFYEGNDYFQSRVENTLEGNSSSRDIIYSTLWQHYLNNNNIIQLAFGEGAYHTFNIAGNDAHNDWLELLIDCGLITTLLYLVYWICFFRDCRRSKQNYLVYAMLGACFIYTFLRTIFSMSFSDMPFCMSMMMGYCFAHVGQSVTQLDNQVLT